MQCWSWSRIRLDSFNTLICCFVDGKDGERGDQNITSQNVEAMYAVLELEPHST